MNKMAEDGINFMRMYTEPACTPTRAALQTGRYAVRSGMHTVSFPVEYSGMDADEGTSAEVLSEAGRSQLHIAETEKYAHVTFFFNDYRDDPFEGEERKMAASPRDVSTYDQKPEMAASELRS